MTAQATSKVIATTEALGWGEEATAGTAATIMYVEPCQKADAKLVQQFYRDAAYTGGAGMAVDVAATQRQGQITYDSPVRLNCFPAYALLKHLGNGADATTGVGPYVHTGTPNAKTNQVNTVTVWMDTGDASDAGTAAFANPIRMRQATISSIKLTAGENTPVMMNATMDSRAHETAASVPSGTNLKSMGQGAVNTKTKLYSFGGSTPATFTMTGSAGAYTNVVTALDITMTRTTKAYYDVRNIDVSDIAAGELMVSGSMTFVYDGLGAGKVYDDYINRAAYGGSYASPNVFKWYDADGNILEIDFGQFTMTDVSLAPADGIVEATITWEAFNDLAQLQNMTANVATPKLSVIKNIIITNLISGAMTS